MSEEPNYITTEKLESEYFVIKKTKFILFLGAVVGTGIAFLFAMYQISESSLKKALEQTDVTKKLDAIDKAKLQAENSALQLKVIHNDWSSSPPKVNGLIVKGDIEIINSESDAPRIKLDTSGRIRIYSTDGKDMRLGLEGKEEGGWIRVYNKDGKGYGRFFAEGKDYTFNILAGGADRGLQMQMDGETGNVTTFRVHTKFSWKDLLNN